MIHALKQKSVFKFRPVLIAMAVAVLISAIGEAKVIKANPRNVDRLLSTLKPGDTLILTPGIYGPLSLSQLNGKPHAWITVMGAESPDGMNAAIITGNPSCNTVEIRDSSYLAIVRLRVDSGGQPDSRFGISATGGTSNLVHDILIQDNVLIGQHADQQNDGISTKTPTWNWTIRGNKILGAGTGIYLGNSDGTDPFIAGVIENNLVQDPIGYDMEIKYQKPRPSVPGMPTGPSVTIIRNNTFIKGDEPSPDGDRSNVLVGGFPNSGPGSNDLYEIYGNFFYHNPREALFQASGRVSLHDNLFVGGHIAGVVLKDHDLPLKFANVYNNTIYSSKQGILVDAPVRATTNVVGNLVFAATPISGNITHQSENLTDSLQNAKFYVNSPSFVLGLMSFYPLSDKVKGIPLDLSPFASDIKYNFDFNGIPKDQSPGKALFRGAYAGEGTNPGWKVQAGIKPAPPQGGAMQNFPDGPTTLSNSKTGRE
jgi:hypothetical protein